MAYSVFENDETIRGWKMGSSVAYCKPCFREVMEVSKEAVAGNDSNDSSKDRAPEKQEERPSTTSFATMYIYSFGCGTRY